MTIRRFTRFLLATTLTLAPAILPGCGSEPERRADASAVGELSMPLVTTANGHTYRLSGSFYVSGPTFQFFSMGGEDEIHANLPTGDYYAYLYSYSLSRLDDNGEFEPVQAELSSSYQGFTLYDKATTTLSWEFVSDGVIVKVGSGNLDVKVEVTEKPPVCTVLGTDCSEGTWCAPAELTARALACIQAGSVGVGEGCSGPTSCVANASCYDFGAGAVCAALCTPDLFGLACAEGGTCVQQGETYGVCTPDSTGGDGGPSGAGGAAGG
jgi:hypothetical protein